jgi:hypothetical protein
MTSAPGCFFKNEIGSGVTINALAFGITKPDLLFTSPPLTCALDTALGGVSPWFTHCAVTPAAGPKATGVLYPAAVVFSDGPGIPPGGDFSLGFGMFDANAEFYVNALSTR